MAGCSFLTRRTILYARQSLIWVEDFSIAEANAYFDVRRFLPLGVNVVNTTSGDVIDVNAQLRAQLFDKIGTRPIALVKSVGKDVEQRIADALRDASGDVETLLKHTGSPTGADFALVIGQLLELTDPDAGVAIKSFNGTLGVARLVAKVIKERSQRALLVHHPTKTYRFHSRAHLHAARQLRNERYF